MYVVFADGGDRGGVVAEYVWAGRVGVSSEGEEKRGFGNFSVGSYFRFFFAGWRLEFVSRCKRGLGFVG